MKAARRGLGIMSDKEKGFKLPENWMSRLSVLGIELRHNFEDRRAFEALNTELELDYEMERFSERYPDVIDTLKRYLREGFPQAKKVWNPCFKQYEDE